MLILANNLVGLKIVSADVPFFRVKLNAWSRQLAIRNFVVALTAQNEQICAAHWAIREYSRRAVMIFFATSIAIADMR